MKTKQGWDIKGQQIITFVVDIGWELYVAVCCVHLQITEVFIWLQNEFISKLHVIIILVLVINQERVVIIKLLMRRNETMEKRMTTN